MHLLSTEPKSPDLVQDLVGGLRPLEGFALRVVCLDVKCRWKRGRRINQRCTTGARCAERLSKTTCTSRVGSTLASSSRRNATKSAARCRGLQRASTGWLLRHPRFHLHFTPTSGSWLNPVERFFALLTERALKRGSHTSVPQLREVILAYVAAHNDNPRPSDGQRPRTRFSKMRRFGTRTLQVHGA